MRLGGKPEVKYEWSRYRSRSFLLNCVCSWLHALLEFDLRFMFFGGLDHEERTFSLTNVAYRLRNK